jgi:hypothetical protein
MRGVSIAVAGIAEARGGEEFQFRLAMISLTGGRRVFDHRDQWLVPGPPEPPCPLYEQARVPSVLTPHRPSSFPTLTEV